MKCYANLSYGMQKELLGAQMKAELAQRVELIIHEIRAIIECRLDPRIQVYEVCLNLTRQFNGILNSYYTKGEF